MSKEPIRGVDDMRRRKVWVPEGDQINFTAMQSLGLSPVVLPVTDVLTGLETGLLDIVAAPPSVALVLQWQTKVSYTTDLPVVYSMGVVAIDKRAWSRVGEADRKIVYTILTQTVHGLDQAARNDNRDARAALQQAGIKLVHVDAANAQVLRTKIHAIYPELEMRPAVNAALVSQELSLLRGYRAAHARDEASGATALPAGG
jgi:TRAP-type C4-dicarboxylate transport system substrate-binding protein